MNRREVLNFAPAVLIAPVLAALKPKPQPMERKLFVGRPRDGFIYWQPEEFDNLRPGDWFFWYDEKRKQQGRTFRVVSGPTPCDPPGNAAVYAEPVLP